ncbi:MAG: WxcM-like domain-containing protein [Oxalobacteraceae bacterium]|nr:MAG: WxcM-like domain-containing protein [Oxalobacteraceae bacterium]
MAKLYQLTTHSSESGHLTVFDNLLPGGIKRVFYIYGAGVQPRAGHRHVQSVNALICLNGSCRVYNHNGTQETTYYLADPQQCLVLEPEDWHIMDEFTSDAVLLVVSNHQYDPDDYIYEPYPGSRQLGEPTMVATR